MRRVEQNATTLRSQAQVDSLSRFDPLQAHKQLQFVLAKPEEVLELIQTRDQDFLQTWSGAAEELPNKKLFVMLNPTQTIERRRVTLLEELAHRHYGHKPVSFTARFVYKYNKPQEDEAYQTAAAVLLPMKVVSQSVRCGKSAEQIAAEYGCSRELVEMRIKLLHLWSEYRKRCTMS